MDFLSDLSPFDQTCVVFAIILTLCMLVAAIRGIVLCFRASRTLGIISVFAFFITVVGPVVLAIIAVVRWCGGADLPKKLAVSLDLTGQ
jgi:hypothetical protein